MMMAAVAMMILGSCQKNAGPSASLKSDLDTLSYELGMANSQGLKMYLANALGVDTAYMSEFYKGLVQSANAGDDKKKAAYFAGIQIGQQLGTQMYSNINYQLFGEDSTQHISMKNFLSGFIAGTEGKNLKLNMDSVKKNVQQHFEGYRNKQLEKLYGANKEAGEKFLAENAKKVGVKTTASGLQYKVLKEGNGPIPADTDVVHVIYEGRLIDGTIFDSSKKSAEGKPTEIHLNQVVKGWTEALTMMPTGSEWEIYLPYQLAYGERETGDKIKPFSALIFKINLVDIKK